MNHREYLEITETEIRFEAHYWDYTNKYYTWDEFTYPYQIRNDSLVMDIGYISPKEFKYKLTIHKDYLRLFIEEYKIEDDGEWVVETGYDNKYRRVSRIPTPEEDKDRTDYP